jgi:acetoin utilization protein AcuB
MLVRDIMTSNVITVPGSCYVLDAERIMESHRICRLPVVDQEELVGIVTKDDVLKASPSSTTPYNQRQLFYLMSKLMVRDIMKTDIITVSPDTTVEKAVAIAQKNRVGSLPVVEGARVLGILTTNDVFYRVLNPLFGMGQSGTRIIVYGAGDREESARVVDAIIRAGLKVTTFWIPPLPGRSDLVLHLDADDAAPIMEHLMKMGYKVDLREFSA